MRRGLKGIRSARSRASSRFVGSLFVVESRKNVGFYARKIM